MLNKCHIIGEVMNKINRNDPCPCGSGKKYKKCCGVEKSFAPNEFTSDMPMNGEPGNPRLKKAILQAISNQLRINDPPETKETLNRLMAEGYSKQQSMEMIGAVLSTHIYDMLKEQREYDNESYVRDLNKLPKYLWED
jgi:hypothetical protein